VSDYEKFSSGYSKEMNGVSFRWL